MRLRLYVCVSVCVLCIQFATYWQGIMETMPCKITD